MSLPPHGKSTSNGVPCVSVVYHFFPHYRAPVLRALSASTKFKYEFWGATEALEGIEPFSGDEQVIISPLRLTNRGSRMSIAGYWRAVRDRKTSAIIILGNPNIRATWLIAAAARALGKKVFYWTHGWLKPEPRTKRWVRNFYYGLAHGVLVYGDRARLLAQQSGFPSDKVRPIYNSLDWSASAPLYAGLQKGDQVKIRTGASPWPELPLLICTARLTKLCRFDLLLSAMAALEGQGRPVSLILVGEGPERARLEAMSRELGVRVQFLGAIYDEAQLAPLIYASDLTVSPGKVGLTAMHSLTYGTPVITHGDLDAQMPEVEAIVPGETGAFFEKDDVADLTRAIAEWLDKPGERQALRDRCRQIIQDRYTPEAQRRLIEAVLTEALGPTDAHG